MSYIINRIFDFIFTLYFSSHILITLFLDSQMLSMKYHSKFVSSRASIYRNNISITNIIKLIYY